MNYSRSNQQVTRTPDTHDNVTDATFASAYTQAATALGVVEKIQIDGAAFNDAMSRGKQEAWATCYAKQIAQGATKQEAKNYANQAEKAGWEKELWQTAFDLVKKKDADITDEVAGLFADAYLEQRVKGESAFYAMAYTRRLVLDEKTPEEASQYASEAEMDSASAAAVPDIEPEYRDENEKLARAIRAELPIKEKMLLDKKFAEQREEGNGKVFSEAYVMSIMSGLSAADAKMYAENFFKLGKPFSWTTVYNTQLIMGQPDDIAKAAADNFMIELLYKGREIPATDTFFYGFYCFVLILGYAPDTSFQFAIVASEQLKDHSQPLAWAVAYARKYVLENATIEEAVEYADNKRNDETDSNSARFSEEYCDMFEKEMITSNSHEEAGSRTVGKLFILQGKFPDVKKMQQYIKVRKENLAEGFSEDWASAYAMRIVQDYSAEYAESFALIYEMQREDDRSIYWAREYADQIAKGASPEIAEASANQKHPNDKLE